MNLSKFLICAIMFLGFSFAATAQTDRQHVRQGNKQFRAKAYDKAEVHYQKALAKNGQNSQALYNIGCTYLQQEKDSMAIEQFKKAAKAEPNKLRRAMSYHNMGVIFQKHREYDKAIVSYEEALRNDPSNHETRYNLSLCKKQQKKNQGGGGNQNQDQKDENNKDQKDKQEQNKNNQKQEQKENKQQEQQKMSKENVEQLLNAAVQDEKATQQRLQKALQQPQRKRLQKNW